MSKLKLDYKLEQIARFLVPNLPETENGQQIFKLKCVTMDGKQVEKLCTKLAYQQFQKFHPEKQTKVFFYLKIDDAGLVFDYSPVLRPPPASMFTQEMEDGRIIKSADRLIFERKIGDKEFDPVFTPDMVGVDTVASIMAALNASDELEDGQQIAGKFTIFEIAQRQGKQVVTVDIGR